jgi:beta-glucanase (GH16 family)
LDEEFNGTPLNNSAGSLNWYLAPDGSWAPDGYTYSTGNVRIDGRGNLAISADRAGTGYTGGLVWTRASWPSGRIEARIQTPVGAGLWPAFWAFTPGGGVTEADIMEGGPGCTNCWQIIHSSNWSTSSQNAPVAGFHTYTMDWNADVATFYLDGRVTLTTTRADLAAGLTWPFSGSFVITLDMLAGDWTGQPTSATVFPAVMAVDYVRIYQ